MLSLDKHDVCLVLLSRDMSLLDCQLDFFLFGSLRGLLYFLSLIFDLNDQLRQIGMLLSHDLINWPYDGLQAFELDSCLVLLQALLVFLDLSILDLPLDIQVCDLAA